MIRLVISVALTLFISQLLPQTLHSQWLYWFVTLPGTALHEAAHWIFAFILQGSPGTFSVIPEVSNGQMESLGHVTFSPNWYNAASVGLAPYLLVFPAAWYVVKSATVRIVPGVLLCYIAACGFASITPSPADWSIAISQPLSFLLAIPLFFFVGKFYIAMIKRKVKDL